MMARPKLVPCPPPRPHERVPFSQPTPRPEPAVPADKARYVIPDSHWLDPPWHRIAQERWPQVFGRFPFPRAPWAFESETRAAGTGLLHGRRPRPRPCP